MRIANVIVNIKVDVAFKRDEIRFTTSATMVVMVSVTLLTLVPFFCITLWLYVRLYLSNMRKQWIKKIKITRRWSLVHISFWHRHKSVCYEIGNVNSKMNASQWIVIFNHFIATIFCVRHNHIKRSMIFLQLNEFHPLQINHNEKYIQYTCIWYYSSLSLSLTTN